jgi:membrane fusion protein, multidrug efflux system
VRPSLRASLEAKVSGRIETMSVAAGQTVKRGDVLAQLDVREIQAKLDQAKALREQAAGDLKRYDALLAQSAATQAEYDAIQSRYRVAEAGLIEAQTMLSYSTISAPFDGVITRKLADVGDLASPGKPLLEMEAQDKLRLEADVPEALLSKVKLGNKLAVRISELPGNIDGVISEISPTADANSRTFRVKLDLPPSPDLRGGQFGRAVIPVAETSSLVIPAAALVQRGQMEIVFVAANNLAQLRLVKTGKRLGNQVEILSGLNTGESIVIDGAATLLDGQPLQIAQ